MVSTCQVNFCIVVFIVCIIKMIVFYNNAVFSIELRAIIGAGIGLQLCCGLCSVSHIFGKTSLSAQLVFFTNMI